MKICIELDKEMQEKWEQTKHDVESTLKYIYGKPIPITENMVFRCMLYCYEEGSNEAFPIDFVGSLSIEEVEALAERNL
jgi:hypothetical protein